MKLCVRGLTLTSLISISVFALSACTPKPESNGPRNYQIPWPTASGRYEIQNVEIKTFNQPAHLKGQWLEIFVAPSADGGSLTGGKPVGRFIEKSDGTLVPADLTTLQATALYAHFERLHEIDAQLGIDSNFIWPAKAGIKVNYIERNGPLLNNAVYDGDLNAIIMVPYTSTDLPLTLNAGVIAHEHFHSIFQDRVMNTLELRGHRTKDGDDLSYHVCGFNEHVGIIGSGDSAVSDDDFSDDKLSKKVQPPEYNRFVLRALNEGIADYWGWMYTGDSNFIRRSLEQVGSVRSLDAHIIPLWTDETTKAIVQRRGAALGQAYVMGSSYARFLKSLADAQVADGATPEEARVEVARAIIESMKEIRDQFDAGFETKFISTDLLIKPLYAKLANVKSASCQILDGFISSNHPKQCPGFHTTADVQVIPKTPAEVPTAPAVAEGTTP